MLSYNLILHNGLIILYVGYRFHYNFVVTKFDNSYCLTPLVV